MSKRSNIPLLPVVFQPDIYLEKFFTQFGESDIFSICIKDAKTKRVCLSNPVCAKFWGLPENAMKGMNAREILTRVVNFNGLEEALKNIEEREQWTIKNHRSTVFQQVLVSFKGFVQVRQTIAAPLSGIHNRIIATSGLGLDITACIEPLQLLNYYRYHYPKPAQAVSKFCAHFHLDNYFYRPLSCEELRTLLTMIKDCRHKQVAKQLNISTKTVANYLFSIRIKLKAGIELYDVISLLRKQAQFNVEY